MRTPGAGDREQGSHGRRVALLSALLAGAAAGLHLLVLPSLPGVQTSISIPWWAVAAAFALPSRTVYVHFGRQTHSRSITEVPLVIGWPSPPPTSWCWEAWWATRSR